MTTDHSVLAASTAMKYVAQNTALDDVPFASQLHGVFDHLVTEADVLRQIAHDERIHKHDSLREAHRHRGTS